MPPDRTPLPWWARALDGVATIAAGLGLLLEITGGPRFSVAGVPVSLASGTRPLLIAACCALVRHLLVRRDPLHHRLRRALARRPRGPFLSTVLPVFLTTRFTVLVVGYLAVRAIGFAPAAPASLDPSAGWIDSMMLRWDAGWYYQIADAGYRFDPAVQGQQNIAFFPAYPLLMRYVGLLLGGRLLAAGLLVSLCAFLWALYYFYRLARQHLDDEQAAAALVLMASYPFAVFYSAVYSESLFLLAAVGAFWHLSRGETGRAAAWGLLAGLTRPNGVLLSVPLLVVAVRPLVAAGTASSRRRLVAAVMPLVGLLVYATYLASLTGDPFAWRGAHAAWGRSYQGLSAVVSGPLRQLVEFGFLTSLGTMPLETLNSLAAVFALAAVWPVTRRFGLAFGLFMALNIAAPLLAGGVLSMGRLTAVLFPIFLWLGAAIPARQRMLWTFVFGSAQALVAALFFTWRQVF